MHTLEEKENTSERPSGIKLKADSVTDLLVDLIDSYYHLGKSHVTEKAADMTYLSITLFIAAMLSTFTLMFLGFGLGWWLGERLGNVFQGFSIVAAIFFFTGAVILALRRKILLPFIRNKIIKRAYK
jgi:hypothetical protein